jgi:signal transduction histidine kinase
VTVATFISALVVGLALLSLSIMAARAGRGPANLWFALSMAVGALWMPVSVIYRLPAQPTDGFMLIFYKSAYTLDALFMTALLLFGYALHSGRMPGKALAATLLLLDSFFIAAAWSGLLVTRISYSQGQLLTELKPLYGVFIFFLSAQFAAFITLLFLLRRRSRGVERTRVTFILVGFLLAMVVLLCGIGLYPLAAGRELGGDWVVFAIIIPAASSAYAMLRHRLLDVHVAARRGLSYLLAALVFLLPSLGLIFLLRYGIKAGEDVQVGSALAMLVLAVLLTPGVKRLTDRAGTLFLHSGLYQPEPLLNEISMRLESVIEVGRGIREATGSACRELGLASLYLALPQGGEGARLLGCRFHPASGYQGMDLKDTRGLELFRPQPTALLQAEKGAGGGEPEAGVWAEMAEEEVALLIPARSTSGWMGNLVAGRKLNRAPLDPQDVEFLEALARRLAVFVETRLLSSRLLEELEELGESHRALAGRMRLWHDAAVIASHELRTPLTSVVGFAHLLMESYDRLDEDSRRECVRLVEENVERLERIMATLDEVNRMRESKVVLHRMRVGVGEIFLRTRMLFGPADNARIDYELPEEDAEVFTDPYLALLILRNLLSNALRYSPVESRVTLTALPTPDRVDLWVIDRGPGIEANRLEETFQPFTRLEDVDKHQAGAGLGLYSARLAASLLETRIEVETAPGRGSTFSFALPRAGRPGE